MKIVLVEPIGGHGGMEIYDYGIAKSLAEHGCEVTYITCDKTRDLGSRYNITVKKFFGSMYDRHRSPLLRFLSFLKGGMNSVRYIRKHDYDVAQLHIFTFSLVELFLLISSLFYKTRVFVNIHDPISFGRKSNRLIKLIFIKLLSFSKIVVTTHTNYSKSILKEMLPGKEVVLMPHSDIDFIHEYDSFPQEVKTKYGLEKSDNFVLFFGQIKKTKGLETLLKAWPMVIKRCPELKLLIVGRCWQNDCSIYDELINKLGIGRHVVWKKGYVPDEDVPSYFSLAEVVVLPYTRIYSSGVLLRAMGYGKPVIVSDQPAFTEIVEHNLTGLVFVTEDVVDLSEKIVEVIKNPDLQKNLTFNASKLMENKYSWDAVGKKMLSIFKGEVE
ncbi:glycosyltransferase family 4 protein [Hydrogenovibrio thermophilus]|uniref:Glycosyltransferase family 1 protein n=1 Tax=Hydrogenovibrio thermophilus TaxID=265883 RepID=A0A410H4D7_9GAMM|nr:glycosyltransferase family 4 protein [Hydrogenovibrio thermophilus]QAB15784.1 glycosyltransferase family 1 protein [Hydrogenovibrio thermophilus]